MSKKIWPCIFIFLFSMNINSYGDIPVATIEESSLPFAYSPNNFSNSPNNFDNSVNNFDNSPSNYDNSESNYDNSCANFDNGLSGSRRIVYNNNGQLSIFGYYVSNSIGVTNFFSRKGKRMFYNPKAGVGLFGGYDGSFCGVLTQVNGKMTLVLTERGVKVLLLSNQ